MKSIMNGKKWLIPLIAAICICISLLVVRNRKKLFASNPYKMNYTKVSNITKAIDEGVSPEGDKTFMIVFGSRSCGACTAYYKVLNKYNQLENKSLENGYAPNFITDVDLEMDTASLVAFEQIVDSTGRNWVSDKTFTIDSVVTPITFFIQDGKLQDIIVGAAENIEQIQNYVKK